MIQRIQTLYLLVVVLVSGFLPLFFPIDHKETLYPMLSSVTAILFPLVAVLAGFSILSFKNRQKQFVLNRINILCNLILLGVLAYLRLNSSGENSFSVKGVLVFIPTISIVFLFLANKAIHRDEKLVKSADRLR